MTALIKEPQPYARLAGFAYLVIFALAIYANFALLGPILEKNAPEATVANIIADLPAFRFAIACFIIVLIADLVVGWALFMLLQPVNFALSLLAALFRITYTIAHIGVVLYLVNALGAIDMAPGVAAGADMLGAYRLVAGHQTGFTITLIFFGVHLILLGWLVIRSSFLPTVIGVLIAMAGAGYITDCFATILDVSAVRSLALYTVILPALLGEGVLCLWLLIRGVNVPKWRETAA